MKIALRNISLLSFVLLLQSCPFAKKEAKNVAEVKSASQTEPDEEEKVSGRLVMFVGLDISGSFMSKWYYEDSLKFLARYIYSHLNGFGGLEIPSAMFVGSIGGAKANEPKTFFPIQSFEHRSIPEIEKRLFEIFPRKVVNPFTDYDAFFNQISVFVKNKKLVLKPISIVMLTDGIPDAPKKNGKPDFRSIKLKSLETLARDITLRVLYTSATTGMDWQTLVPRQRVKVWTQDANVMKTWKDDAIFQPHVKFPEKHRFFDWIKDNIDFKVSRSSVD